MSGRMPAVYVVSGGMRRLGPLPLCLAALSACVGTVPRPEPLGAEPLAPEDARPGPARPRAVRERPTRACLPKALAEHGRVTQAKLGAPDRLTFCMREEGVSDDTPDACFDWNLESQAFRVANPLEPPPPPEEPAAAASPRIDKDAVSLCSSAGKCTPFVSARALPRTERYRREADDRLFARVSEDGKLVALVRQPSASADDSTGTVEVWSAEQRKLLKRFKVTSPAHGDQIAALRFLGRALLVEQCDAGPACTGRLFDPATGKQRLEIPVNFYGAELYPLAAGRWLFVDGWLRGAAVVDVDSARLVAELKSGVSGPAEDAGRVVRLPNGELLLLLSGAGAGAELAVGGTLIRLDPSTGASAKRFAPPGCAE
ncbi:MAG: hypothetical protein DYH12_23880 [Sorangiineae bacterium PRO1]|nr:hypothetical protein [Sorangiineae bacterium PRO1]